MDKLASSLQELSTGDDNREVPGTEPAKDLAPAPGSEGASSTAPQPSLEKLPVEIQRLILCNAPTVKMLSALVHASPQLHGVYADDRLPILRQVLAHSLEGMLIEAYGAHLSGMESFQRRRDESTLWVSIEELEAKYAAPFVQTYKPSLKHIIQLSDFHTSVIEPLTEAYASWALASLPLSEETARNPPGRLSNTERRRIQRAMYRLQLFCNVCGSAGEIIDGNLGRLRVLSMFSAWEVEEILSIHEFAKDKYSEAFQKVAWDLNEEKNPKYSHIDMTSVNEFLLLVSDAGTINERSLNIVLRQGLSLLSDTLKAEDHDQLADMIRAAIVSGSDEHMPVGFYGEDWIDDAVWDSIQDARREKWPSDRDSAQDSRQKMLFDGDNLESPPLAWVLFWKEEYSNLFGSNIPKGLRRWGFVMWDATRLDSTAKDTISLEWYTKYDMTDPREYDYT